jgi:hypothetical protein
MNNPVRNYRNLLLEINCKNQISSEMEKTLIKKLNNKINNLKISNDKIDSITTILKKQNQFKIIVEFKRPSLSMRENTLLEEFSFIENEFLATLTIEAITVQEIVNILKQTHSESWELILFPKFI